MAKKQKRQPQHAHAQKAEAAEVKSGLNVKDRLGADALSKLKQLEQDMKTENERKAQQAAEQKRREQEERERNKSFGELLEEYEKKGIGKFS